MTLIWIILAILLIYALIGVVIGTVVVILFMSDEEWRRDNTFLERLLIVLMTMVFWPQMFKEPPE